ncbi:MAG: hypothetical protein QM662_11290 [Gordonia sp. (in: high G+C Gram-positive bacteria)]
MLPTLWGRLQTRVLVLAVLGGLWTVVLCPVLWVLLPAEVGFGETYAVAFVILTTVIVLGVVWEFVYHFLQQFRWEKDWPTLFGLVTAIPEGIVVWFVAKYVLLSSGSGAQILPGDLPMPTPLVYSIQFVTTWLLIWIVTNGPLRAVFPRWRFQGGRFL